MSKDEVRRLLGDPDQVYSANEFDSDAENGTLILILLLDAIHEKWAYGERRLLAAQPAFPYVGLALDGFLTPADNDHVLFFSKDGQVIEKRSPYRTTE